MTTFSEKTTNAKNSMKSFFKKLVVLLVIIGIGLMFFFYYATLSKGVKSGVIIEVSERGALFKTYEGQMDVMSFGAVKSANSLSQTFLFSVEKNDKEVFSKLEEVSLSGERVRLRYEEKYVALPWRGETKYFITDVERSELPEVPDRRSGF